MSVVPLVLVTESYQGQYDEKKQRCKELYLLIMIQCTTTTTKEKDSRFHLYTSIRIVLLFII